MIDLRSSHIRQWLLRWRLCDPPSRRDPPPPCTDAETPHCDLQLNPSSAPISKSAPRHHHLLIKTRSTVRGLLSDMATPSSLSSQQPDTRVTYVTFNVNVTVSFHLHTPFPACCWHHYVNTNTIFLSSSPGRGVPFNIFLISAGVRGKRWWGPEGIWDMGELWETRVQSVVSQHEALFSSLAPPFFLCFFFGRES